MDDKRFRSDRGRDPIAELARLIAKADTHDESVPSDNRSREETVSDEAPELPPAPQLTVGLYEHEQGCERDEHCYGVQAHDIDDQPYAAEEEYPDSEVPAYAASGQPKYGTDCLRFAEPSGYVDGGTIGQRYHRADTGGRH